MQKLLTVLVLTGIFPIGGGDDPVPFPVEAEGDVRFYLDAARFRVGDETIAELYLSIPEDVLEPSPDSSGHARIRYEVRLEDHDGDLLRGYADSTWLPIHQAPQATEGLPPRHLLTLRPTLIEGVRRIRLSVEDLSGRKRGLIDRVRGRKPGGEAIGRFEGDPLACGLSDLAFAWDLRRAADAPGLSARERLEPNPQRYYGLYQSTLLCYLERYDRSGPIEYRIVSLPEETLVASGRDSVRIADGPAAWMRGVDLSTFPAGRYRLEVGSEDRRECASRAEFQILWDSASWMQDQKAMLEEAYVLLSPTEYERVEQMSRGEVEVYLRELWNRHDPDPSTGRNELRDRFVERMEHANRFFSGGLRKGMTSDRGRVYIRFGPPDEVESQLNPQDEKRLALVLPQVVGEDPVDVGRKPHPRGNRDDQAYEIWTYQVRGDPLFPDLEVPVQRTGLKFIFVDDLGYGDMRLVYTNLSGAF